MHLSRSDGEQDMGRFSFKLPPGVVPRLAGIPYCSETDIAQAASRQGAHGGQEEKDHPSCPAASQIGRTVAGAGVGNQLTYVPGSLYLAGPYHGDPISAVSITPAVAGPFDAGTVVVREALRLNPVTHVGEVDGSASDPIPHILKGIPLNLRDLQIYADKDRFTLNATSCDPFEASSTIWGDGTALEPLSPSPVELSSRYQAAGCASLGFKPELDLRLKGGTRRGAFPALRAAYVPRKHNQANLRRLALTFPHSEFIEQGHFRTICTRVQFAAGPGFGARCPKGSIYGHVKAWTPLLDEPLSGPVYLRSSNHNLPDAVLALHGLVDIEVATRIDSVHGRLRAIVADVPDAPVSRAVVRMQGGQKGLFVNSRDLCHKAKRNRARVDAKGQNNRRRLFKPLLRALGCGEGEAAPQSPPPAPQGLKEPRGGAYAPPREYLTRSDSTGQSASYSLPLTAEATACWSVPSSTAVLVPAGEGRPTIELTSGSMKKENSPPHPFAPGAANELLSSAPPLSVNIVPASFFSAVPAEPWIGSFGGGGEVSPLVKSIVTGLESEPM